MTLHPLSPPLSKLGVKLLILGTGFSCPGKSLKCHLLNVRDVVCEGDLKCTVGLLESLFLLSSTLRVHYFKIPYKNQESCHPRCVCENFGNCGQSNTAVSLRCNFSDYVLRNNYMFRPMVAIFRLSWEYLRATVSCIARIMQRSLHVQLADV